MKRIFIPLIIILLACSSLFALRYDFNLIPEDLKVGADAVVRTHQCLYTIVGPSKTVYKEKMAITLLNENALSYLYQSVHYNKFKKINFIKASVYDQKGKLIEVLNSSDFFDMSAVSGSSFHSDDRQKVIRFPRFKFPYTVEYEYEVAISSIISYPTWAFQPYPNLSVEKSGIQYVVPKGSTLKYREVRIRTKVDSIEVDDKKIYTWQVENIPAYIPGDYSVPFGRRVPVLLAAPLDFEFDGYKGSTQSWQTFGDWNRKVIENRDVLSDAEIKKVRELVKDIPDERQRIKAVYEYMQSRSRYVAISLGIGGLQPMPAKEVESKGYGDCKALTNYTMALLKAVGVKSHYTLVLSGSNRDIISSFVSNQFDHVILCVPQPNDTIWLECTSQTLPFNYLSDFTSDRYVLLTTEEGGKIARTPAFKKEENIYKQTGTLTIISVGDKTQANFTENYSGVFYGDINGLFSQTNEEEIKRILNKSLNIPTYEVNSASLSEIKSEQPSAELSYSISIRDFSSKSANRIFFAPCINKEDFLVNKPSEIEVVESSTFIDSLTYELPTGYVVEHVPQDIVLESPMGKYSCQYSVSNNKLVYFKIFEVNKGRFKEKDFKDIHQFINSIAANDRQRVILKRAES